MELDSVNWPSEFSEIQKIDSCLKCGICYDYLKTTMITSCSHMYCSLCIRKFLQYSCKCPTCFEEVFESGLRNNRPLDSVITYFLQVRGKLLKALRIAIAAGSNDATIIRGDDNVSSIEPIEIHEQPNATATTTPKNLGGIKGFMTPTSSKSNNAGGNKSAKKGLFAPKKTTTQERGSPGVSVTVPRMFTVSKPVKESTSTLPTSSETAPCPVCSVDIPSRNINYHLDVCLARSSSIQTAVVKKAKKKREPLPKRLYSMMNDKMLKKSLRECNLSTSGDRRQLISRIKRYIVLYNAETDVENPRPVCEIVKRVEREEREERRRESSNILLKTLAPRMDRNADPQVIDEANKQYINDNRDHFKKLIEAMKSRNGTNIKPLKPSRVIISDGEDDVVVFGASEAAGSSGWNDEATNASNDSAVNDNDEEKDTSDEHSQESAASSSAAGKQKVNEFSSQSSLDSVFECPSSIKKKTPMRNSSTTPTTSHGNSRQNILRSPSFFDEESEDDMFDNEGVPCSDSNDNLDNSDVLYQSIFESESTEAQSETNSITPALQKTEIDEDKSRDLASANQDKSTPTRARRAKRKSVETSLDTESIARSRPRRNTKKRRSVSP